MQRASREIEMKGGAGVAVSGDDEKKRYGRIWSKLLDVLPVFHSADVRDLTYKGFAYYLALAYLLLYSIVFAYGTVRGTIEESQRKYLAVTLPAPGTAECALIPMPSSGLFVSDLNGMWNTRTDGKFQSNSSIYQLQLVGTSISPEQYTRSIELLGSLVKTAGDLAKGDTFGTLLGWSFFYAHDPSTQMSLRTTANIQTIFAKTIPFGDNYTFASANGVCILKSPASAAIDSATFLLTFTLPLPANTQPAQLPNPCPGQLQIGGRQGGTFSMGYPLPELDGYKINFSWLQLAWAYAVNFGLLPTSSLRLVRSSTVTAGDFSGVLRETFESHAMPGPGVSLLCYSMQGKPRVCLPNARSDDPNEDDFFGLVYPVILPTGGSSLDSFCGSASDFAKDPFCYLGGTVTMGLFYSKNTAGDRDLAEGKQALLQFAWSAQEAMADVGVAVFKRRLANAVFAVNSVANSESSTGSSVAQFKTQFTSLVKNLDVGLLVTQLQTSDSDLHISLNGETLSLKTLPTFSQVAPNDFGNSTLPIGAINSANNTLYVPRALANMQAQPPVSLVQPYFQCHATVMTAFVTGAGVAAGNASIVSNLFVSLSVSLFVMFINNVVAKRDKTKHLKIQPLGQKVDQLVHGQNQDKKEKQEMLERIAELEAREAFNAREREDLRRLVQSLLSDAAPPSKTPEAPHPAPTSQRLNHAPTAAGPTTPASGLHHFPQPPRPPVLPAHLSLRFSSDYEENPMISARLSTDARPSLSARPTADRSHPATSLQ